MIVRTIYTRGAALDLKESRDWLENRESGLGDKFYIAVKACIHLIRQHPQLYPVITNQIRRARVKRFPYEVIYGTAENTLTIYSVFHCSQSPEKLHRRIGNI